MHYLTKQRTKQWLPGLKGGEGYRIQPSRYVELLSIEISCGT